MANSGFLLALFYGYTPSVDPLHVQSSSEDLLYDQSEEPLYGQSSSDSNIFTFLAESFRRIPSLGLGCGTNDVQWCPYYLTGICLGLLGIELIISCIECSSSGSGARSNDYEMASTNNRKKRRRNRNRTETRF